MNTSRSARIFSFVLFCYALFLFGGILATGHHLNLADSVQMKFLAQILLFAVTAIALRVKWLYRLKKAILIIFLLTLVALSLIDMVFLLLYRNSLKDLPVFWPVVLFGLLVLNLFLLFSGCRQLVNREEIK